MEYNPIDKIRFSWKYHKAALFWLGLLCRKPRIFIRDLPKQSAIKTILTLYLHFFLYFVVISLLSPLIGLSIPGFFLNVLIASLFGITSGLVIALLRNVTIKIHEYLDKGIIYILTGALVGGIIWLLNIHISMGFLSEEHFVDNILNGNNKYGSLIFCITLGINSGIFTGILLIAYEVIIIFFKVAILQNLRRCFFYIIFAGSLAVATKNVWEELAIGLGPAIGLGLASGLGLAILLNIWAEKSSALKRSSILALFGGILGSILGPILNNDLMLSALIGSTLGFILHFVREIAGPKDSILAGIVGAILGGIVFGNNINDVRILTYIMTGGVIGIFGYSLFIMISGILQGIRAALTEPEQSPRIIATEAALGTLVSVVLAIVLGLLGNHEFNKLYIMGLALGFTGSVIQDIFLNKTNTLVLILTISLFIAIIFGLFITNYIAAALFLSLFIIFLFKIYYYPIHFFFFPLFLRRRYRFHPVMWDDLCLLPFPGLYKLLISFVTNRNQAGSKEIERLIANYPAQKMQALKAKALLLAQEAADVKDLLSLDKILKKLPDGEGRFFKPVSTIREMVTAISQSQRILNTAKKNVREPFALELDQNIKNFQNRISGYQSPLADKFYGAATKWQKSSKWQLAQAQTLSGEKLIPDVFRAGRPVNRNNEAFILREGVIEQFQRQILVTKDCPGILLYSRRRMGKTTILNNLSGFLPSKILVVVTTMLEPQLFTSTEFFIQTISQRITTVIPERLGFRPKPSNLSEFDQFLDHCNKRLKTIDKYLLLAIDEYNIIDGKIKQRKITEDLLLTLRHSIQTHRHIIWTFAGSHHISELKNAQWTSHLVSIHTIEVPLFTQEETEKLLTEPLAYSEEEANEKLPIFIFTREFWGKQRIKRIHKEAGGWPHLIQFVAQEVVFLLNNTDKRQVDDEILEQALSEVVIKGDSTFIRLMRSESRKKGEWAYLANFKKKDWQEPPASDRVYQSLKRRLLIEKENGHVILRVPLMQRWLRERG